LSAHVISNKNFQIWSSLTISLHRIASCSSNIPCAFR
jgi:hypothetical protein